MFYRKEKVIPSTKRFVDSSSGCFWEEFRIVWRWRHRTEIGMRFTSWLSCYRCLKQREVIISGPFQAVSGNMVLCI